MTQNSIVATFAGDSGDGVQLLGTLFSDNIALQNYQLNTFPDYPAEIRAPAGTVHGVSGFKIQWGGDSVITPGDASDILVAFNAAAFKKYRSNLKSNGILIYDPEGFDSKNCKLAQFDVNELEHVDFRKFEIPISKMTTEGLKDFELSIKEKNQNKNIFALGFLLFSIENQLKITRDLLADKFKHLEKGLHAMQTCLNLGYNFAETIEFSISKSSTLAQSQKAKGIYRNIQGNTAVALALMSAPEIFGKKLLFGGYPITPASDILHELARYPIENLTVVQAEDEIAAIATALGASYGGAIGVTASSGPGLDLKQETISLAHSTELPLLIIDVQRAGPSTGMPTKVEQSDLELAYFGRHGECPVPILAIKSPASAYQSILDAIEIMIQFQTPLFVLSDVSIANGAEPWLLPTISSKKIDVLEHGKAFSRNENLVKPWISPGTEDHTFVLGGLEKGYEDGGISYDAQNHEKMTHTRQQKIDTIANYIPAFKLEDYSAPNGTLILSWGSTFGAVKSAVMQLQDENSSISLAHGHLEWIRPFPKGMKDILKKYDKIIIAELNMGQLAQIIRSEFCVNTLQINKMQGTPFLVSELKDQIKKCIDIS
jgi:2-oxoglutarate ferredoxin oxidoreductase subunit alpha